MTANPDRTIRNCKVSFGLRCPKQWDLLAATASERIRYCGTCDRNVYLCASIDEVIVHAEAGRCIAFEMPAEHDHRRMFIGEASAEYTSYRTGTSKSRGPEGDP